VVSVYVLGFGFGPLVIAPPFEMYGCYASTSPTTSSSSPSPSPAPSTNLNILTSFRFIVGCAWSTPLTLAAGTIADTIEQERRGATMSFLAMGQLLGPVIGPATGGYLSQAGD
jgi:MFS family permease